MFMLVRMSAPGKRNNLLAEIWYVVFTVAPWVAMIWLLWPRW